MLWWIVSEYYLRDHQCPISLIGGDSWTKRNRMKLRNRISLSAGVNRLIAGPPLSSADKDMIWLFYPQFSFIWLLIPTERVAVHVKNQPRNWWKCERRWFVIDSMPFTHKIKQQNIWKTCYIKRLHFGQFCVSVYNLRSIDLRLTLGDPLFTASYVSAYHNKDGWIQLSIGQKKLSYRTRQTCFIFNGRSHGHNLSSTPGHAELDTLVILQKSTVWKWTPSPNCVQGADQSCTRSETYSNLGETSLSGGRILGRNPDKSLKSFPPCYSQLTLQICLVISISSNS